MREGEAPAEPTTHRESEDSALPEHVKTTPSDEDNPVDAASIETDIYCIRCGYNLRGLQRSSCCPECSMPVADSLRGDLLSHAAPDWLARIARGASLILYGTILLIGGFVAIILFSVVFSTLAFVSFPLIVFVLPAGLLLIVVGSWRFTELEPRRVMIERPISLRAATRAATVAVFVVALIEFTAETVLGRSGVPTAIVSGVRQAIIWCSGTSAVVLVILLGYRVAELAERLPDLKLARTARRRARTLGVCVALEVLMNAVDSAPSALSASGLARWVTIVNGLLVVASFLYFVGTLDCVWTLRKRLRSITKRAGDRTSAVGRS